MTDKKKYILAGVIAGVAVIGSYVYLQVQKAVNYVMTYKYFKVDKISFDVISFNVVFSLLNRSEFKYHIKEIVTDVYLNNQFVTKVSNFADQVVEPEKATEIIVNVALSPKDIKDKFKIDYKYMLLYPEKIEIKMETNFRISWGFLWFTIPFTETFSLKTLKSAF